MLRSYKGVHPKIAASAFVEQSAQIIGDVVIGEHSSVWFNAVVRGDVNYIRIGRETNIQDGCVLHVFKDLHPLVLGDRVTVGHSATLHGCSIENDCLIGMGAIILNGARVGSHSIIAAGTVVAEGTEIAAHSLYMGVPGRFKRRLNSDEEASIQRYAANYIRYKDEYLSGTT